MTEHLYARDIRAIRRAAEQLLRQCDHYEENTAAGGDDKLRFGFIWRFARDAAVAARRAERRYYRKRGWTAP